jgi:LacI family transcriptional regulator
MQNADQLDISRRLCYNDVSATVNANSPILLEKGKTLSNRVTIADVAREAGVSSMTVSRVINDKDDVSPATRQRVLEVVERLGYRPSGIARSLATQRTRTLGLVVPDVANPFFSDVVRGVEQVAYAQGYNVFLCNTEEKPERELAVLQSLEEKRVDGLVICSSRLAEEELQAFVRRNRFTVLVNRQVAGDRSRSVMVDDESGGKLATQHLLATGHRSIGFLSGPPASHSGQSRAKGYRDALKAAGVQPRVDWTRPCAPAVEGGQTTARQLLTAHPELTALFCYNDLVAVGALQACADLGLDVPRDLAVIGYDDIPLAGLVTPPLTTCRVARHDLGGQAVQLLLDHIDGCQAGCGQVVLHPELIVRASAPEQIKERGQ